MLDPWKESYDKPRQHIKKQRHPFAEKEWRHRCREFTCGHSEGGSGTNGESSINMYTLSCVKEIAGEKLLYNTAWYSVLT